MSLLNSLAVDFSHLQKNKLLEVTPVSYICVDPFKSPSNKILHKDQLTSLIYKKFLGTIHVALWDAKVIPMRGSTSTQKNSGKRFAMAIKKLSSLS